MKWLRIEVANYCNLECKYCFFADLRSKNKDDVMSFDEFKRIVSLCRKEGIKEIYIQGGEPMQNPNIEKMINLLVSYDDFNVTLFTNGLFPIGLTEILNYPRIKTLLNYNHPNNCNNYKDWEDINQNIKKLKKIGADFSLGFNFYQHKPDYGYFIDAIKKYKFKNIRWDLARPSGMLKNSFFSFKEIFSLRIILAKFLKDCLDAGAFPNSDCPLPVCFTKDKIFSFLPRGLFSPFSSCDSIVNIGPGLRISSCPASVMFDKIRLDDFGSLNQVAEFVSYSIDKIRWRIPSNVKCKKCFYWENRLCQGGCVGYKRINNNKVIGRRELHDFFKDKDNYKKISSRDSFYSKKLNKEKDFFKKGLLSLKISDNDQAFKNFIKVDKRTLSITEKKWLNNYLNDQISFIVNERN
ncbi:MAG: radical SAM protein [Candidatus Gygaella obscura]|nr:radical SAM protein [Candidatus Gygaella obscura]